MQNDVNEQETWNKECVFKIECLTVFNIDCWTLKEEIVAF